jgi:ribosome-associated protein
LEVTREVALLASKAAAERQAENVALLELKGLTVVADYFLVASGQTGRQVKAIAEHIEETLEKSGIRLLHREGLTGARWALLDYGGLVCHIFSRMDRDFYGLDRFWGDAPRVPILTVGPGGEQAASALDTVRPESLSPKAKRGTSGRPPRRPSSA